VKRLRKRLGRREKTEKFEEEVQRKKRFEEEAAAAMANPS
jgi:hypothetical protein